MYTTIERRNDLVFYAKNHEDIPGKLRAILETLLFEERIELYRSVASLKQRFCLPSERRIIAIIYTTDKEDLLDITSMKYFFSDVKVVLVLPSKKKDVIALGHSLRPRFITYKDADFRELLSVIHKMSGDPGRSTAPGGKAQPRMYGK
ncbi:MAG: hypothetical protein PHT96_07470 [Syntrophorhabdaceae bacterium]|nr:hypothetical protein [Syntrophorhabdaceae bacterium]MDD4196233.1 hypothetical protein [Syntrophorhabdaceae bacterium]HOC45141.1 hypothetical protein [Syntrophorhabdaceae bacterium]